MELDPNLGLRTSLSLCISDLIILTETNLNDSISTSELGFLIKL